MGQGRWIRESNGDYRHYTEEEYQKLQEERNKIAGYIIIGFLILFAIGIVASIFEWIVERKMMWLPVALGIIGVIIYLSVKRKSKKNSNRRHRSTSERRYSTTRDEDY